jgi:hypothetical protein
LARNGAVTLDTNEITLPDCDIGSISGRKVNDRNGDGILQPGEPGLPGLTVFLDSNGNGVLDPGEMSTTTDANGNYTFANLLPGTYRVREAPQAGIVQTTPNPATITLGGGQDVSGVNFGDFRLISISGVKFQDTNGNGVRDSGEAGLRGWTIFLDANRNGVLDAGERRTTTDANGNYTFANLGPGTYRVREVGRLGWVQMTNNPPAVIATSGVNVSGRSFGNARVVTLIGPSKLNLIGQNMAPDVLAQQARFVANLYVTVLGHAPDLTGLTHYVRLLQAGYTRPQVTALFMRDHA